MNTVACLITVTVTVLGLICTALRRDLTLVPCVQLAGVPRDLRRVQRTFAVAVILALMLQMVPVNVPPPSKITASLISKAPAPLNTAAPYLSKAMAPLDALVPPFSNIQPVFADPTVGITITKSASPSVNQVWGGNTEFRCAVTLTNPSGYTITVSSQITDSVPISTTAGGGTPEPGWAYLSSVAFRLDQVTNTTSYAGEFLFYVDTPVPDGTIITNTAYCFTGTIGISPTQFCETTPITTEIKAPDFSLTESWASASGTVCAGQRLTYTITISNPGRIGTTQPFTVTGVITSPLTIYTDTLSPDASWSGNTITWTVIGDERFLDPGGADTLSRTFAVSVPTSLANGTNLTNTYTIASPEVAPTQDSWSSSGVTVSQTTAAFTSTSPVCLGETMVFTSTGEGAISYEWSFGDGVTQTTTFSVVSHNYSSSGSFAVVLTATGTCGSAVTQATVTVNPLPTVSGLASNSPVCLGQTTVFTWFPSNVSSLLWDFGDGGTETSINMPQTHIYTATGIYTVTLMVTSTAGCSNSYTTTVSIEDTYASFIRAPSGSVCTGATTVQFTDTSTTTCCSLVSREWSFGDGSPVVTATNPSHVFTNTGTAPLTRTVTLTVTNGLGCADVATGTVIVNPATVAGFTPVSSTICTGQSVIFANASTGVGLSYQWDFGDGLPITTTVSPTHVFTNAGTSPITRTVTLTATGTCGTAVTTGTVTVNPGTVAGFTPVSSTICTGQSVIFANASTGVGLSYEWDFGDGITSTVPGPTHVFTNAGTSPITRTVTLTTTGTCGTAVTSGTVTVNPLPTASFSRTPMGPVCVNQVITFTNTSTNAISYLWNFGNGITSTQQHPTHTYATTGTFTVWLTATNACGSDVTSDTVTVSLSPSASFTATTPVCLSQAMTFTNTGSVGTYLWTFGDGITSTIQNPSHTYVTTGTFTVWLTTTNTCGSAVTSNTVTVNSLPTASFTSNSPVNLGQTMYFTNTGSTGTYQWNLGDNSPIQITRNVTHTYGATGNYVVWLTTTLGAGCWGTYSATVTVTATTGCEDAYEPDDSRAEATTVTPPGTTRHNFDEAGDVDWVGFQGTAGITYTIETLNLTTGVDTKLNLYSWDSITLTLLASNDDRAPGDRSSLITWAVTTDGWYYVETGRFTGSYYGCDAYYDLRIAGPLAYVYLPIILKGYPPPEPTPTPGPPTPTPGPCYPLVERTVTVGNDPRGVAFGNGMIYVANYGDGTVSVINGVSYGVTKVITGVTGANGVAYDSTHNLVYVTQRDSARLAVIDASANTISRTLPVGSQPHGVAYNPTSHKIYVANYGSDSVTIIDANTMTATATISGLSKPAHVTANPDSNKVYISNYGNGTVTVIHGTTNGVVATVSLGSSGPYGIAADTWRNLIYVVSIEVANLSAPNLVTIDGDTDQVQSDMWGRVNIHKSDDSLVPLRVIAVHPGLGSSGHLYITSSSGDVAGDGSHGTDQLLMSRKGWPEGFNRPNPLNVGSRPEEGVAVDLVNNRIFVTARYANRLTVIRDTADQGQLCVTTFALDGYVIEPVP